MSEGDTALVARVRAGDRTAFDVLVRAHMRQAFQLAYRIVGQREDAEDLVQDAFLAAYTSLHTFDTSRPFAPWLMRIVMNRAANLLRSLRLRRTEPEVESVSLQPSALEESERAEQRATLERALAGLTERQRMIVLLFDVDGRSSTEIGSMLDLSAGTVRWHLHEARRTLRAALLRFYKDDG